MKIVPAIDIINGKCVRLTKGDFNSVKIYNENPLEVAKTFEDSGIEYLHLVDLDGSKAKKIVNYKILESIASKTNLKIDFGGGLRTNEDLKIAFNSGANQITGGSIAIKNRELFSNWIKMYGSDKIILGADCKNRRIAINGWQNSVDVEVVDFITEYVEKGIKNVICTDIEKDGMLQGPSTVLYRDILKKVDNLNLVASGGVSTLDDLYELREIGCHATILGKAIYENRISLKQLENFILNS
ncbi:MAG: 1-(5-phosphoribosyl)-5-[(5-phosphoribosylamino)methylideneamino]imidazole-4-carboxamide isomerase [Bacteroidetes bacterium MedPE-SWsnd-G2]|nr:MAG: 1-(5-phosphoribosyl)-5-[(5-phosphoribosylamino)methylideneamino]imidazole-4-carboxamide isomerase [Bacteroidetes bacterium MedPE-SWsnd-G2]